MKSNEPRYTRKNLPFELRCEHWPELEQNSLTDDQRVWKSRMQAALVAYLEGGHFTKICEEHLVQRSAILRLLNACVQYTPEGELVGWRALVKGAHRNGYTRIAAATPGKNNRGLAGVFTQLLEEHPQIKKDIEALALKKRTSDKRVHEARASGKSIHDVFLIWLREERRRDSQYPFNTDDQACTALTRFVAETRAANFARGAWVLGGKDAARRAVLGTGRERSMLAERPFDLVSADAHRFDFIGSVRIPHPKGARRIAIQRLNFLPVFEEFSYAVLGYVVVIGKQCKGQDAVRAIKTSLELWQPRALTTPGLNFPVNAGMPSALVPQLVGAAWAALKIDNDSIFLAAGTAERTRRRVGCALNYGPVGQWARRSLIEAFFGIFERRGFQRMPSTTGSSPKDSRRDDAEGKAIALEIDWEEVLDLVDIMVATYNVRPQDGLGGRSPIELLTEYALHPDSGFFRRVLPPLALGQPDVEISIEYRTIRGNVAEGRTPYIEIDGVHYRNPLLAGAGQLIGTQLVVHLVEDDLRTVTGFLPNGGTVGVLTAQGEWGRIKHDRSLRKTINRCIKDKSLVRVPGEDIITTYLRLMGAKALSDTAKSKAKRVSKAATEVARVANMTGLQIPVAAPTLPPASSVPRPTSSALKGLFQPPKHRLVG